MPTPKFLDYEQNCKFGYAYDFEIDYLIDEDAKWKTNDLRLSIHNSMVKPDDASE